MRQHADVATESDGAPPALLAEMPDAGLNPTNYQHASIEFQYRHLGTRELPGGTHVRPIVQS